MALLTVSQDLGVFGWGDDSQIFRDILSLPIMMPIVQGLVGPGFRMDHSPFCIRMQRGSERILAGICPWAPKNSANLGFCTQKAFIVAGKIGATFSLPNSLCRNPFSPPIANRPPSAFPSLP
jgi:hypothetical protein